MNDKTKQFVLAQTKNMTDEKAAKRIQYLIHCPIAACRKIVAEARS